MPTRWKALDVIKSVGMDTKSSKTAMPENKMRLAQNLTYREPGALKKRNGFTKVNTSVPVN